jgi:hypothetical protein
MAMGENGFELSAALDQRRCFSSDANGVRQATQKAGKGNRLKKGGQEEITTIPEEG